MTGKQVLSRLKQIAAVSKALQTSVALGAIKRWTLLAIHLEMNNRL